MLYVARDGFSPRRIHPFIEYPQTPLDAETIKILDQPFYFLGKGRQCFAFASKDGNYVLKCPRTHLYELPFWVKVFGSRQQKEELLITKRKRQRFMENSLKIAQDTIPEMTGVIAVHFASPPTKQKILLVDPLGCPHVLPLSSTLFILQKKYPLWTPQFLQGSLEEKKRLITALVSLFQERGKKGVLNRDGSFLRNYAFDGRQAYQIDIGDLFTLPSWDPAAIIEKSLLDSAAPIREWMGKNAPSLLPFLEEEIEKYHPRKEKNDRNGEP